MKKRKKEMRNKKGEVNNTRPNAKIGAKIGKTK